MEEHYDAHLFRAYNDKVLVCSHGFYLTVERIPLYDDYGRSKPHENCEQQGNDSVFKRRNEEDVNHRTLRKQISRGRIEMAFARVKGRRSYGEGREHDPGLHGSYREG